MDTFVQVLSEFGFPVFAFGLSVYALKYTFDKNNEAHEKSLAEIGRLAEAVSSLAQAVNHNSETLLRIMDKIGVQEDG